MGQNGKRVYNITLLRKLQDRMQFFTERRKYNMQFVYPDYYGAVATFELIKGARVNALIPNSPMSIETDNESL